MKKSWISNPYAVIGLLIIIGLSSCTSTKQLRYFQDLPNIPKVNLPAMPTDERIIEPGDNITITINAQEKDAVAFFNTTTPSGGSPAEDRFSGTGHVVTSDGFVEFPILGRVNAAGLTAKRFKEHLTRLVGERVKDPLIDVRFNTFRITVIGEVRSPGIHMLPMQRTSIFEALAMAGDLSQNGKRYDIHLYRDYLGERSITKFDLRKKEVLEKPELFNMRHNDVIYVQPMRSTLAREDVAFYSSFLSIIIGVVSIAFTIINNN